MALAGILKKINPNAVKAAAEGRSVGKKIETLADKKRQVVSMIDNQIKLIDDPNAKTAKGKPMRKAWYVGRGGIYYSVKFGVLPIKLFEGATFYGPLADLDQLKQAYTAIQKAVEDGELDRQIQEAWDTVKKQPRGKPPAKAPRRAA